MSRSFNLKKAWIASVVGYSIFRAVVAWGLFSDYGLNPWVFAVIDVGTAIPYATAIAELPGAIAKGQRRPAVRHATIAIITFLAPYVYVWWSADGAPTNLRVGLIVLTTCLFGAAALGLYQKTKNDRRSTV